MENSVFISDYTQMDRILKEEKTYLLNMCNKIKKAGCNVLLIQKSILRDAVSDLSLSFLAKMKILVVKDVEREDIEFICKVRTTSITSTMTMRELTTRATLITIPTPAPTPTPTSTPPTTTVAPHFASKNRSTHCSCQWPLDLHPTQAMSIGKTLPSCVCHSWSARCWSGSWWSFWSSCGSSPPC